MTEWYCFKDKVKMQETDVELSYMKLIQRVPGLKCPKCGTEYLTEKTVMTTVQGYENLLEAK
jgi:YgiT-type zinc finger domain-containing protein